MPPPGGSFRLKLIAAALAAQLAMLGLLVWQGWQLMDAELREQLKSRIATINPLLNAAIAVPLAQRDYATLGGVLTQSVGQHSLDYIVVEDHLYRRIAAAGWPAGQPVPDPSESVDDARNGRLHIQQQITLGGQVLGQVSYGVSTAFRDRARTLLGQDMLRIGLIGILLGLLLLVPLSFWLMRRLAALERSAQRLAAGDLGERIHLSGDDELTRLAEAFNQMADGLEAMIADLRKSETRFHHAVHGSSDGIWDWDIVGGEYYFSPRHKEMLGYGDDELASSRDAFEFLVHPDDRARLDAALASHFDERTPFDIEMRLRHRDGRYRWCRSRGQAVWDAQGRVVRFAGATTDITDRKEAETALQHLAHYDSLTQLPNRTLLADRLTMALAQARRADARLAVGLIDLDGFKPVNDSLGHEVGDLILIEVAERLRAALREGDTVARLGGDEFVLVLSARTDQPDYERALSRLLGLLAQPYLVGGKRVALSASIGVTFFPEDDSDPDTLLRHADQAMYVAKQAGRNRWHIFDAAIDRDMRVRQQARGRLVTALAAGELVLHYQPKVDLRAGRVIGAEALLRWQHPQHGLVAPGEFLGLFDNTDHETQLSEWVIDTALAQMAAWQVEGLTLDVSVNLPARHLQDPGFADFLRAALARQPTVAPARLELEVLESAAFEDVAGVSERMEQCRRIGVRFALDDFGTGYASLAYLRRLPIEMLKIDQSFVRDMLRDLDDLAIVQGIIGLAAAFRDTVIAEGVETTDHGVMLLHLGCDLAQGNGIARPMPAHEIPGWVAGWTPHPDLVQAATVELKRADLVLATVEVEHRGWVERTTACVRSSVALASDFPPLDAADCRLGQWLEGDGRSAYGMLPEFRAIEPLHHDVHAIGRTLAALCREQHHAEALQRLPRLLARSEQLIEGIHQLIEAVARANDAKTA